MMNYEDFVSEFEKALEAEMPGLTLRRQTVNKVNGPRDSIAVMFSNPGYAPLVYLDDIYQGYQAGMSVEECATSASEALYRAKAEAPDYAPSALNDPEHKLYASIICRKNNEELLSVTPHKNIPGTDLTLVARYRIDDNSSFLVNNSNFSFLGMKDADEVMALAVENTSREQFFSQHLGQVLSELIEIAKSGEDAEVVASMEEDAKKYGALYVVSNANGNDGSVALGYPEIIKRMVAETGEEQAFILPMSRMDLFVLPASVGRLMGVEEMKEIIHEVNEAVLRPDEVLNDSVYFWNGSSLSMAEDMKRNVTNSFTRSAEMGLQGPPLTR